VSPTTQTVRIGGTFQFTAVTRAADGGTLTGRMVTWGTSNPSIITVNQSGLVSAAGLGTANVTATSEGKIGSATVTVVDSVATVQVSPSSANLAVGESRQLSATLRSATGATLTGRTISWVSTNAAVATVDANGLVRAIATGSATIRATSEGKTGTSSITVTGKKNDDLITMDPAADRYGPELGRALGGSVDPLDFQN
jgi:uncharacterized protein YjdB